MKNATTKPGMVVVRVFGTAEIRAGEERIGLGSEAKFAVALYLTTRAGERVPRAELLELFWEGGSAESRRHNLSQMLYRLRQSGVQLTESTDAVGIDRELVDSDINKALHPDWPETASPADIEAALGHALAFSTRMPAGFLSWLEETQAILGQRARRAAMRLIMQSRNEGRWTAVEQWSRAVLSRDPLNEEATLALVEAAVMLGSKEQALEILDTYIGELGSDAEHLGRPALAMRRRLAERRIGWTHRGTREVSLIGREQAMARLTHVLTPESGATTRSALLLGASGFGKSRLLHEARDFAALRGIRTLDLRADSTETSHPWALVRSLVRALIDSPGSAAVSPHTMSDARTLARPEADSRGRLSIAAEMTPEDILGCLLSLLAAVSDECRLLVTLDDLHRSDAYSLSVIGKALVLLSQSRCAVIAAGRPGVLSQLVLPEGQNGLHVIRLTPLSQDECRLLAHATAAAHNLNLTDSELDHIAEQAGGHPHFARELALFRTRGASFDSLPLSLSSIVDSTLSHQSPESLRLLRIAALLGDTATTARVQRASDLSSHKFLSCIESLSDDAIIHLNSDRTIRIHDSWRDSILSSMPDVTAAALALECAVALSEDSGHDDFKVHRRLAALYWTAGESGRATELNLAATDSLLSSGLFSAAADSIGALNVNITDVPSRLRLRAREALALLGSGRSREALAVADEVWRSRGLHSSPHLPDHLLAVGVSADAHVRLNRADEGPADELVSLARSASLSAADRARACLIGVRLTGNLLVTNQFREFEQVSAELAPELPSSAMLALTRLIAAAELHSASDIIAAQRMVSQVDEKGLSASDRCLLLRCSANALRIAGNVDAAADTAKSAAKLAEQYAMSYAASTAAELVASILLDQLDMAGARKWIEYAAQTGTASDKPRTLTSRDHILDRLEFAQGRFTMLASRVEARITSARAFGVTRGRFAELALAAAVLSNIGRAAEAEDLLPEVLGAASKLLGRFAADHTLDLCLHAADGTRLRDQAHSLAERHLKLRDAGGVGTLPQICIRLRDLHRQLS